MTIQSLFAKPLGVINMGVPLFADAVRQTGAAVVQVDWTPPPLVDAAVLATFARHRQKINEANSLVCERILNGKPLWVDLQRACDVVPGMTPDRKKIFHAGPPVTWERMCGPMRGAIVGALIYEELANTPEEAERLAASGSIEFSPCHEHSAVGPMAGVLSASMPVFVIKNEEYGNTAYCSMNEGLGKVLRYGAFSEDVIARLRWMERQLWPILQAAVRHTGGIDLKSIIAQALHMGDEVHNRNRAGTSLLYRALAPAIVETCEDRNATTKVLQFINGNDHFFLNLCMAACKATLDAARDIPNSSIAIVMARNGTDFGIQLSSASQEWFTGPALVPDALFFPGFSKEDANPDIGDSAITETAGLGGFAIAAAPAIVQFVGGTAADARNYTLTMYEISATENTVYRIPYLDFRGTPTGIDIVKVVESGILPFIDTGVAHREAGVGQVGAGVVSAPMEPFLAAAQALAKQLNH